MAEEPPKKHTAAWYIVPILLGIIGGIIGYLVVRDDDRIMARNLLIIGIIMTFVIPILVFIFAWAWLMSLFGIMGGL